MIPQVTAQVTAPVSGKQAYLEQTKAPLYGLIERLLASDDMRDQLRTLETDQKGPLLQQKQRIIQQAPPHSLQTLVFAKMVASFAYDEFKKRATSGASEAIAKCSHTTALLSSNKDVPQSQASLSAILKQQEQLQAQLQELRKALMQRPLDTQKFQDAQVRRDVECLFAAWLVQNCPETLHAMRVVATRILE